jgi:hypothetical protein
MKITHINSKYEKYQGCYSPSVIVVTYVDFSGSFIHSLLEESSHRARILKAKEVKEE